MARDIALRRRQLKQRKCVIERAVSLAWIVHDLDRAVPNGGKRPAVTARHEWREIELGAMVPALGDDLRTDAGRIAKRDRNRVFGRARHRLPLAGDSDQ